MWFLLRNVYFPKQVEIFNPRLAKLFWILAAGLVTLPVMDFYSKSGLQHATLPHSTVSYWATNWKANDEQKRVLNIAEAKKDYCTSAASKYEYCDSDACTWSARDMTCADLCTADHFEDCLEDYERWFKDPKGGIFFPTYFTELSRVIVVGSGEHAGNTIERRLEEKSRIIKGVEDLGVGFNHGYFVEDSEVLRSKSAKTEHSNNKIVDATKGLLTIVRSTSGIEVKRFFPGQQVELPLKLLLDEAKISLDDVKAEYGSNFLADAEHPQGILARLAGAEITIEISYHNQLYHGLEWEGPVAFLTILGDSIWTSRPDVQTLDHVGNQRFRYYQGIRVNFRQKGLFYWRDYTRILQCITSVIVFIRVANQIAFFFATTCLGGLSIVYRGFCYEKGHLDKTCCSLATHLASYTSTFLELQDLDTGISCARLLTRFKRVFGGRFSDLELKRFAHFVVNCMQQSFEKKDQIDMEEWCKACIFEEPLGYDSILQLFDSSRKKGPLEILFGSRTTKLLAGTDALVNSTNSDVDPSGKIGERILRVVHDRSSIDRLAGQICADSTDLSIHNMRDHFFSRMEKLEELIRVELMQKVQNLESGFQKMQYESSAISAKIDELELVGGINNGELDEREA